MPLKKGVSPGIIRENIKELLKSGKKKPAAIAAAMRTAGKRKGKG